MNALKIAEEIFADGKIDNPDDWDEMEVMLDFELNERGITGKEKEDAMTIVKEHWYAEGE